MEECSTDNRSHTSSDQPHVGNTWRRQTLNRRRRAPKQHLTSRADKANSVANKNLPQALGGNINAPKEQKTALQRKKTEANIAAKRRRTKGRLTMRWKKTQAKTVTTLQAMLVQKKLAVCCNSSAEQQFTKKNRILTKQRRRTDQQVETKRATTTNQNSKLKDKSNARGAKGAKSGTSYKRTTPAWTTHVRQTEPEKTAVVSAKLAQTPKNVEMTLWSKNVANTITSRQINRQGRASDPSRSLPNIYKIKLRATTETLTERTRCRCRLDTAMTEYIDQKLQQPIAIKHKRNCSSSTTAA